MKQALYVLLITALISCNQQKKEESGFAGPLKEFFQLFSELKKEKGIDNLYNRNIDAVERGDEEGRLKIREEFKIAHDNIVQEITKQYPINTVKLPFKQGDKSKIDIEEIFISKYYFPWGTATRLAYNVCFKCLKKTDEPLSMVRFEYYDVDNDIIISSNCSVTKSGTFEIRLWADQDFFQFKEILVMVM